MASVWERVKKWAGWLKPLEVGRVYWVDRSNQRRGIKNCFFHVMKSDVDGALVAVYEETHRVADDPKVLTYKQFTRSRRKARRANLNQVDAEGMVGETLCYELKLLPEIMSGNLTCRALEGPLPLGLEAWCNVNKRVKWRNFAGGEEEDVVEKLWMWEHGGKRAYAVYDGEKLLGVAIEVLGGGAESVQDDKIPLRF